jgi:hypothetical protein
VQRIACPEIDATIGVVHGYNLRDRDDRAAAWVTAARKVSAYIPHTGMDVMLPPTSFGVIFDPPIRWLDNRTTPVTRAQIRPDQKFLQVSNIGLK